MITLRPAAERGHVDHGWLDTWHTFSFAGYRDRRHLGFRSLRVINEDRIAPARGFPPHPHADMEILTYVVSGALRHEDSLSDGSVIVPGDIQRLTAGTGVTHSEFNASDTEAVHLLQIWIHPERRGLNPGYEQRHFSREQRRDHLQLVASPDGREGSITLHQDVSVYATLLDAGTGVALDLPPERHAWVQVVDGSLELSGARLQAGDGAAASEELRLTLTATEACEALVFDLA